MGHGPEVEKEPLESGLYEGIYGYIRAIWRLYWDNGKENGS